MKLSIVLSNMVLLRRSLNHATMVISEHAFHTCAVCSQSGTVTTRNLSDTPLATK